MPAELRLALSARARAGEAKGNGAEREEGAHWLLWIVMVVVRFAAGREEEKGWEVLGELDGLVGLRPPG